MPQHSPAVPAAQPLPTVDPRRAVVQPMTPAQAAVQLNPSGHHAYVIPQQPGMLPPIVPKTVGGLSFPNDLVKPGSTPMISDEVAREAIAQRAEASGEDPALTAPVSDPLIHESSTHDKREEEKRAVVPSKDAPPGSSAARDASRRGR